MARSLCAVAVLFAAAAMGAQQLSDQITVNVVEVPVYVSRYGSAIRGLTKDDFVLTVNGRPQRIDYFDVIENAAPPAEGSRIAAQPTDLSRRRLIVLLFDLSQSSIPSLRRARESADRMVRVTYLLGFRLPPGMTRGDIDVRLRDSRLFTEVRFRRSFSTEQRDENPAAEPLMLADVLLNDIPQNGLSVDLAVQSKDGRSVMTAAVPGHELLRLGKDAVALDAFIYVFDERGQVVEWAYRKSTLDLIKGRNALTKESYTITSRVSLPAGRYAAKVLLRTSESDVTGFARTDFVVSR